jgi:hypothetical protein
MKIQKRLTKKTKDICENLAIECLNEVDEKFDTIKVIERFLLLLHKNLGVYKMTAFSELVHVFDRILTMAEEGSEFHLNIEGIFTKWENDIPNDNIDNWKDSDYATIFVTVKHYEEVNKYAFDDTLKKVIELLRSCIDPNDYEEGDIEYWRREVITDDEGNELKEKFIVSDDGNDGDDLTPDEDNNEFKTFETTYFYSFYSHSWGNED